MGSSSPSARTQPKISSFLPSSLIAITVAVMTVGCGTELQREELALSSIPIEEVLNPPPTANPMLPCTFRSFPQEAINQHESSREQYDKMFVLSEQDPVCLGQQKEAGLRVIYFESRGPTRILHLWPSKHGWGISHSTLYHQEGFESLENGTCVLASQQRSRKISELVHFDIRPWQQENEYQFFLDGDRFIIEVCSEDRYHRYHYRKRSSDPHMASVRELVLIGSSLR